MASLVTSRFRQYCDHLLAPQLGTSVLKILVSEISFVEWEGALWYQLLWQWDNVWRSPQKTAAARSEDCSLERTESSLQGYNQQCCNRRMYVWVWLSEASVGDCPWQEINPHSCSAQSGLNCFKFIFDCFRMWKQTLRSFAQPQKL